MNNSIYTVLVLLNATPAWLSLSRVERSSYFEQHVVPIFIKVGENVKVRLYDSEYFHAKVSDYMIIETSSLEQYKFFIEMLRDTKVYAEPYFTVSDIIVGEENAFKKFDELLA